MQIYNFILGMWDSFWSIPTHNKIILLIAVSYIVIGPFYSYKIMNQRKDK